MLYIYFLYFLLGFLIIQLPLVLDILYFVQLSGYKLSSIFKNFIKSICDNYLNVFLCLVIMITMIIIDIDSELFSIVYLIIELCLWIYAIDGYNGLNKLKFTKRIWRILATIFILDILLLVVCCYIDLMYLSVCFPFLYLINYIFIFIALVLLCPVEKMIGLKFINRAKSKLSQNKKIVTIGITGSYGKTSTKEILNGILSQAFYVLSTPASYNTPFGISKTINDGLENTHEIFICEMGAKKRGEIRYLCNLVSPSMGIVTAVGRQHTNTFGSIQNIYKTKKELPDSLYGKYCVFNLENFYVKNMYDEFVGEKTGIFIIRKHDFNKLNHILKSHLILKIGNKNNSARLYFYNKIKNVYAKNLQMFSDKISFDVYYGYDKLGNFETELLGEHNVLNILLAIAISLRLGVKTDLIKIGLSNTKNIHARLEKGVGDSGAIVINNGYNSNIDSAKYSLAILRIFDNKKKLIVTPGLIECEDNYKYNFEFGKLLSKYADEVIVVKKINRKAILDGLKFSDFNMRKVCVVDSFNSAKNIINGLSSEYVVLIENDLPDNFV